MAPPSAALAGDLFEAYQSGRSRLWYWQQVSGIIVASISFGLRRHPVVALRAIAFGLAFMWFVRRFVLYNLMHYDEWLFATGLSDRQAKSVE